MTAFPSLLGAYLSPMEQRALHLLLAGEHPVFEQLRRQLNFVASLKREDTAVGFYLDIELSSDAPTLPGEPSFALGDVGGEAEGSTYGVVFVVFVKSGHLVQFEGANCDEVGWPKSARTYDLYYAPGKNRQRDLIQLRKEIPILDQR